MKDILRGLVVSPEDGLAAPLVAVVVAIALTVAPAITTLVDQTHIFLRNYLSSMGMQVPSLQAEMEKYSDTSLVLLNSLLRA